MTSKNMKNFKSFANRAIVHIKELIERNDLIIPYKIDANEIELSGHDISDYKFEIEDEFGLNKWVIEKYIDYENVVICKLFISRHNTILHTLDTCIVYMKNLDKHFTKTNMEVEGLKEHKNNKLHTIDDFIFTDYITSKRVR